MTPEQHIKELEILLEEALELAAEGLSYTSDYFRDKWGMDDTFVSIKERKDKLPKTDSENK